MEQQQFKCSGDCLKCSPIQRQYCSSQFTYNTMRMVENLSEEVSKVITAMAEMKVKIEAIQGNEALLFDPMEHSTEIAQSGDGA